MENEHKWEWRNMGGQATWRKGRVSMESGRIGSGPRRESVRFVAVETFEDADDAVGFTARGFERLHVWCCM